MRTAPALRLGPTNSANNSYRFINLTNGQRFVSHIAYPREYDDEVRDSSPRFTVDLAMTSPTMKPIHQQGAPTIAELTTPQESASRTSQIW